MMVEIPIDLVWRFDEDIEPKTKRQFMLEAIEEAHKGDLLPKVGAVVVVGNKIVARGHYHQVPEGYRLHAEEYVLGKIDKETQKKSVLYCTLEPCAYRSTARDGGLSCSKLIANSWIPKVVMGLINSDPKVNGQGVKDMLAARKSVELGVEGLEKELEDLLK